MNAINLTECDHYNLANLTATTGTNLHKLYEQDGETTYYYPKVADAATVVDASVRLVNIRQAGTYNN